MRDKTSCRLQEGIKRGDISMLIDLNERHTLEDIIIGDILCNDGKDVQKYSRTTQITF
jgi:hypothetical protein